MDLQYSTQSFDTVDHSWLANLDHLGDTVGATLVIASAVADIHYPSNRIKPGTIVAQYTGGANDELWAPYYQDWSDVTNTGLDTAGGIVIDGFETRRDVNGTLLSTVTSGSILPAGVPQQVFVGKLPGLVLEDGTTDYTPVVADLPSGFYDITGI